MGITSGWSVLTNGKSKIPFYLPRAEVRHQGPSGSTRAQSCTREEEKINRTEGRGGEEWEGIHFRKLFVKKGRESWLYYPTHECLKNLYNGNL